LRESTPSARAMSMPREERVEWIVKAGLILASTGE
jgi:hypothetical protein